MPPERLKKFTEENLQIAANLKMQMDELRREKDPKLALKKKKGDSDFSSNRGSEDRQIHTNAGGRGQKRGRDIEAEKVRISFSVLSRIWLLL